MKFSFGQQLTKPGAIGLRSIVLPGGDVVRNSYFATGIPAKFEHEEGLADGVTKGRPFDVMAPGTYRPGSHFGLEVTFPAEDMDDFLKNTLKAIASTMDEDGNILGLTIDSYGHAHGSGAAGWLIDVWLEEFDGKQIMRGQPMWTDRGVALIEAGLFKWYSGEFDLIEKVMKGGSLTNWPATRLDSGEMVMRPILLSQDIVKFAESDPLADESLEDKARRIREAFWLISDMWVQDVYDDRLVASADGKMFSVDFSWSEERELIFERREDWEEVKQVYVPVEQEGARPNGDGDTENPVISFLKNLINKPGADQETKLGDDSGDESGTNNSDEGDTLMAKKIKKSKTPPDELQVNLAILEEYFPRGEDEDDVAYQIRIESLGQFSSAVANQDFGDIGEANEAYIQAEVIRLEAERTRAIKMATDRIKMVADTERIALELVGGSVANAKGLPIDAKRMSTFLLSLNPAQYKEGEAIFQEIVKSGLVDYVEKGSEESLVPVEEFPPKMKPFLLAWVKEEGELEDFFIANSDELMAQDQYDLGFVDKYIGDK